MRKMEYLKLVTGSLLFALTCYAILAAPGFLSDEASTVALHRQIAMVRS